MIRWKNVYGYVHDVHGCNMHQQADGLSHQVTKIFYEHLAHGSYFENFGEPTLVDVRFILLVEDDKMEECIYPRIELETPSSRMVYMGICMMCMDAICINK